MSFIEKVIFKIININQHKYISELKLKDLFLQVNKNEVIDYANKYIIDDKLGIESYFELFKEKLNEENDYIDKRYSYFYLLSKTDYSNEHSNDLLIECGFSCTIWGVDQFLRLQGIKENMDYNYYCIENIWATDIYLDCNIDTRSLDINNPVQIVALFILQDLYLQIFGYNIDNRACI